MDFSLGVNYWPVRQVTGLWRSFDLGEVREDFARLHEWRLSPVRIFLRWEDFQPEIDEVNLKAIDRLVQFVDLASVSRLSLWVTLFCGHTLGANWFPHWMLLPGAQPTRVPTLVASEQVPAQAKNPYLDGRVLAAQKLLLSELLAALAGHPALSCWDLGNAPCRAYRPPERDLGRRWLGEIAEPIRKQSPGVPITLTLCQEDLEEDTGIGPAEVSEVCDRLAIHAFPDEIAWARSSTDHLVPLFLAALARTLGAGHETWIAEVGIPQARREREQRGSPDEESLLSFVQEGLSLPARYGFAGALWASYADPTPAQWNLPPLNSLERHRFLGLLDHDWKPKPFFRSMLSIGRSPKTAPLPTDWMDCEPERYWREPAKEIRRLFGRFIEQMEPE